MKNMSNIEQMVIADFNLIHGGKYTYPRLNYNGAKSKITATCRVHGDFEVYARAHRYRGQGCKMCRLYGEVTLADYFLGKAKSIHCDNYVYENVEIEHLYDYIQIGCRVHGLFKQRAAIHMAGSGCPKCKGCVDWDNRSGVYLMRHSGRIKVGVSNDPDRRLDELTKSSGFKAELVKYWIFDSMHDAGKVERVTHWRLEPYHAGLTGFDGATEWFNTTPCHAEWVIGKVIDQYL